MSGKRIALTSAFLILAGMLLIGNSATLAAPGATPAATSAATVAAGTCSKAPALRLKIGDMAQVTAPNITSLPGAFLKEQPDHLLPVLRYLPVSTVVQITDGPKCDKGGDQWWSVKLGDLKGWMTETSGQTYILTPATGTASTPVPSTLLNALRCIKPNTPPAAPKSGDPTLRVIFGTADGDLDYSDNGGPAQAITHFSPALLSVDLSPDGSAALVVNHNGVYWVDVLTGQTIMVADSNTFQLPENSWPVRARWRPDGRGAAVEIEDNRNNVQSFAVWNMSLDGSLLPFRVDTGGQPTDSLRLSPQRDQLIVLSASDFSMLAKTSSDEPKRLLEYTPLKEATDAKDIFIPAVSWEASGKGFYTYIPVGDFGTDDDPIAGHVWYVPIQGETKDMGKPADVKPTDYVIPSPDGKNALVGNNATGWTIQSLEAGSILQTLPSNASIFDWTPDGKGVVFVSSAGKASFLGVDGGNTSSFVPAINDLFDLRWLPDGTMLYLARGKDEKLTFSIQKPGKDPVFMGIVGTTSDYRAALFEGTPTAAKPLEACK